MHALVKNFFQEESGASMVEYGLLVALIAIVVGAAALVLGQNLSTVFSTVASDIAAIKPSAI